MSTISLPLTTKGDARERREVTRAAGPGDTSWMHVAGGRALRSLDAYLHDLSNTAIAANATTVFAAALARDAWIVEFRSSGLAVPIELRSGTDVLAVLFGASMTVDLGPGSGIRGPMGLRAHGSAAANAGSVFVDVRG